MNEQERTREDRELREYALEAQRHPPKSKLRRVALTKLVEGILRSRRISHPYRYQFPESYEEIRNEAIHKTAIYICEKIDKYNPDRGPVIRWFNYLLEKQFFPEAIAEIVGTSNIFVSDENAIEYFARKENKQPLLSEQVKQYLEEDPEGLLKNLTHKVYPQVNFGDLVCRRISEEKWKEISADLGVQTSTLSDFYQRCLKEIAPQIKCYLKT